MLGSVLQHKFMPTDNHTPGENLGESFHKEDSRKSHCRRTVLEPYGRDQSKIKLTWQIGGEEFRAKWRFRLSLPEGI